MPKYRVTLRHTSVEIVEADNPYQAAVVASAGHGDDVEIANVGLLAVGALVLSACGARTGLTTTGGPATGVVTGRVTAGPTCPVERVGHPCPPRPVVADVQARAAGRVVASTRSRADGTYR